jgi:hypothetical protein
MIFFVNVSRSSCYWASFGIIRNSCSGLHEQVLPGIAFALDLVESTGQTGVQEVLLATVCPVLLKLICHIVTTDRNISVSR